MTKKTKRCLAMDLDGTLLRSDQTVADEDVRAIAAARAAGVQVAIVTGRISSGVLPFAQQVGVNAPLVCADGGLLIRRADGAVIARKSVPLRVARAAARIFRELRLVPFAFTDDAIHAHYGDEMYFPWVRSWSPELCLHSEQDDGWPDAALVVMLLALGDRASVEAAQSKLAQEFACSAECVTFAMGNGEIWAVRVQARGCNKGTGLAALAARLGVTRSAVAYVGDWYNDVSAFAWAGASFCMGQAPPEVRAQAREVLRSTSERGGGIAEVVSRWL